MKNLLVVAYYFPPMGLSGVQRVSKFVKYLPQFGWNVSVLTVDPRGYFAFDDDLLTEVQDSGATIYRTKSLDPTILFGSKKQVRYPAEKSRSRLSFVSQLIFIPDNKIGWYPGAIRSGKRLIERKNFDAILASVPPYTCALIGKELSKAGKIPLLVDFRDDWVGNPRHQYLTPIHKSIQKKLEADVLEKCSAFTTINEHIRTSIIKRNSRLKLESKGVVITQGFDPEDFKIEPAETSDKLRLLYNGVFYDAQKPDTFLTALSDYIKRNPEANKKIEAVFVGLVPDYLNTLANSLGIQHLVKVKGYVPHNQSISYLLSADVLWMVIGKRPGAEGVSTGKLYEYIGSAKPILALVPEGEASRTLKKYGASWIIEPDDVAAISGAIEEIYRLWQIKEFPVSDGSYIKEFDRKILAELLSKKLLKITE